MKNALRTLTWALLIALIQSAANAHGGGKHVTLHINPRWSECSFQLAPELTQAAWRQFTYEAGLVTYFRPLVGAKSMGIGNYEFSLLQWSTDIDDTRPQWNDTFVHPDSTHWLMKSDRLAFPGLTFRAGISDKIDVGAFLTKSPGANYGFWGAQTQYNAVSDVENDWAASARVSFVSIYGPEDLDFTVYGFDLVASKDYAVYSDWVSVTAYAGVSAYLSSAHEKSAVVDVADERVMGLQGMIGAVTQISMARIAVEYNFATVSTVSMKVGIGF